ncbi:12408_t:CDS:1, partial [Gigaspora rosea]
IYSSNVRTNIIEDHFIKHHNDEYKSIKEQYFKATNHSIPYTKHNVVVIEDNEECEECITKPTTQHSVKNLISKKGNDDLKRNISFDYGSEQRKIRIIINDEEYKFVTKRIKISFD